MPKSTAVGNGFEIEVKKTLEKDGYSVFRQHRKPLFMKGKMITIGADVFGCDLIARKQGQPTLWVQVSTVSQKSTKEKQVLEHPWNLIDEKVQLWLRVDGKKEFRVFDLQVAGDTTHFYIFRELETRKVPKE